MSTENKLKSDKTQLPEDLIEGDFFLPEQRSPTHPGEMLQKEFLDPLDMTQRELADHMGVHVTRVNELIRGKRRVTAETAAMLARVLDTSERFWLNLQSAYDLYELKESDRWQKIETVKKAV